MEIYRVNDKYFTDKDVAFAEGKRTNYAIITITLNTETNK